MNNPFSHIIDLENIVQAVWRAHQHQYILTSYWNSAINNGFVKGVINPNTKEYLIKLTLRGEWLVYYYTEYERFPHPSTGVILPPKHIFY